ncbi:IclR family transcriptional regulator [Phaeovulum sp. NW3]|uniref:IclR family transcriptional regulator n=1 Tax=Phaeovulum sp. NW3 TaxID=2934933 RepID=UPI002021AC00|nr:IclR family transcriptional regulator [Phaeovulum sp. NW3]MCL7466764.1 IclR family transcriptional regulator [Phaeovulum sp. NW3]
MTTKPSKADPSPAQTGVLASTLERGMRVLALFRDHHTPLSLTEIATLAGLEKSAAQRLTYTLHALGYLDRDDKNRRYRPGLRMLDLAYAYLIHDRLLERALPRLIELSRQLRSTVNLGVLDGHQLVYKARIPHSSLAYDATLIGVRQPAAVTAIGQVIAAFSPPDVLETLLAPGLPESMTPFTLTDPAQVRDRVNQARRDGFVISVQQIMPQEIVVAAPVMGPNRRAIAAIAMPVYMPEWTEDRVRADLVPALTDAARAISSVVASN